MYTFAEIKEKLDILGLEHHTYSSNMERLGGEETRKYSKELTIHLNKKYSAYTLYIGPENHEDTNAVIEYPWENNICKEYECEECRENEQSKITCKDYLKERHEGIIYLNYSRNIA